MSKIFGPIFQNGFVIRDMQTSLDHWVNVMGVGPFYSMRFEYDDYRHKGQKSHPVLELAFADTGHLQIELIQQVNDAPSGFSDFLNEHGEGLQHLGVLTDRYEEDVARLTSLGYELRTSARVSEASGGVAFFQTAGHGAPILELVEADEQMKGFQTAVRKASQGWDGSRPIRRVG